MKYAATALITVATAAAMIAIGCGGDSVTIPPGTNPGTGGGGGSGGGSNVSSGKTATDFVTAGGVSKSPSYKMVHTFGQPTQNQGKTSSPGYRLQGGLNGANGSLP